MTGEVATETRTRRLDDVELREFVDKGYLKVPSVVPSEVTDAALRVINEALAGGGDAAKVGHHHWVDPRAPELVGLMTPVVIDLAEQLSEPGAIHGLSEGVGSVDTASEPTCQVALVFPSRAARPLPPHPHLDGIPHRRNPLPPGQVHPFTLLAGVVLSEMPAPNYGNLLLWPGSHRLLERWVREHPDGWLDDEGYGPAQDEPPMLPLDLGEPAALIAGPGDVVISHYQLGHAVMANTSPHIRYMAYFRFAHRDLRQDWSQYADIWRCHPALAHVLG